MGFQVESWSAGLAEPLTSCMLLDKLLILSEPQFLNY